MNTNKDEVLRLAKEAGASQLMSDSGENLALFGNEAIERFAALLASKQAQQDKDTSYLAEQRQLMMNASPLLYTAPAAEQPVSGAVDEREAFEKWLFKDAKKGTYVFSAQDGWHAGCAWQRAALRPAQTAPLTDERELDLYDEIECDLPYLFSRASAEGHESGQRLAKELQEKMRKARTLLASQPVAAVSDEQINAALGEVFKDDPMGAIKAQKAFRALLSQPAAPAQPLTMESVRVALQAFMESEGDHFDRMNAALKAALSAPAAQQPSDDERIAWREAGAERQREEDAVKEPNETEKRIVELEVELALANEALATASTGMVEAYQAGRKETLSETAIHNRARLHSIVEAARCLGVAQEKGDKAASAYWSSKVDDLLRPAAQEAEKPQKPAKGEK